MLVMLASITTNLNADIQSERKDNCNEGDPHACFKYAKNTNGSDYVKQKYFSKAWKLYVKRCNEGYGGVCYEYGNLLRTGQFRDFKLKKDLPEAAKYYVKGCDFGDRLACSNAGLTYDLGNGIPKNINKARGYYKKSCELGYKKGCKQYNTLK